MRDGSRISYEFRYKTQSYSRQLSYDRRWTIEDFANTACATCSGPRLSLNPEGATRILKSYPSRSSEVEIGRVDAADLIMSSTFSTRRLKVLSLESFGSFGRIVDASVNSCTLEEELIMLAHG
jgi:hypothetical protein